jgi:hypothetical protein
MAALLASLGVLAASALLFRAAMPRRGKTHRFVGTIWEPYVVVALVTSFVVSLGVAIWKGATVLS